MTVMTNARFDADGGHGRRRTASASMVGPEGKEPPELRAEMMLVATGRAANIEDIGLETTKVETDRGIIKVDGHMRTKEPHVYAIGDIVGGLLLAHTAAPRGDHRGPHDRRRGGRPRDGLRQAAARDVLPAGDRLDRPDRGAGARQRGLAVQGRQGPVPGDRQGAHRRRVRGLRQGHRRHGDGRHARRPHHRAARDGPDRRGEPAASRSRRRRGRSARATHAHPTLSEILGEAAMAVDGRSSTSRRIHR